MAPAALQRGRKLARVLPRPGQTRPDLRPPIRRKTMKTLLVLCLGLGVVSSAACKSQETAEVKAETVDIAVSGMT